MFEGDSNYKQAAQYLFLGLSVVAGVGVAILFLLAPAPPLSEEVELQGSLQSTVIGEWTQLLPVQCMTCVGSRDYHSIVGGDITACDSVQTYATDASHHHIQRHEVRRHTPLPSSYTTA